MKPSNFQFTDPYLFRLDCQINKDFVPAEGSEGVVVSGNTAGLSTLFDDAEHRAGGLCQTEDRQNQIVKQIIPVTKCHGRSPQHSIKCIITPKLHKVKMSQFCFAAKFAKKGLPKRKNRAIMLCVSDQGAPRQHWDVAKR